MLWHANTYVCACICLHIEIWKYKCERVQNDQLIHKHIHLTFYQSRHWMISRHVDIIHVRLYLWICIWIYVPTCRNKWNWCTLKHLVLVRINGPKKSPKIPGNTFSDALLKSRLQNFAADAARKKRASRGFFWRESRKKMMRTFNNFLQGALEVCCFVFLTQGWGRLETRPPVALGSSSELSTFTMSLLCHRSCHTSKYTMIHFKFVVATVVFFIEKKRDPILPIGSSDLIDSGGWVPLSLQVHHQWCTGGRRGWDPWDHNDGPRGHLHKSCNQQPKNSLNPKTEQNYDPHSQTVHFTHTHANHQSALRTNFVHLCSRTPGNKHKLD